jgi:hypothetical protein
MKKYRYFSYFVSVPVRYFLSVYLLACTGTGTGNLSGVVLQQCCGSESELEPERIQNFLPNPHPNPNKNSDWDTDPDATGTGII